jgi:hypothetical protein
MCKISMKILNIKCHKTHLADKLIVSSFLQIFIATTPEIERTHPKIITSDYDGMAFYYREGMFTYLNSNMAVWVI